MVFYQNKYKFDFFSSFIYQKYIICPLFLYAKTALSSIPEI